MIPLTPPAVPAVQVTYKPDAFGTVGSGSMAIQVTSSSADPTFNNLEVGASY